MDIVELSQVNVHPLGDYKALVSVVIVVNGTRFGWSLIVEHPALSIPGLLGAASA